MFLSIEEPIITEDSTFLDRLGLGGQTLLIGMLTVFAMLFVIYLAMIGMRAIFARKAPKTEKSDAAPEEKPIPASVPQSESTIPATQSDDCAIVAAITAAIASYTGKAPASFRVVSFKRRTR